MNGRYATITRPGEIAANIPGDAPRCSIQRGTRSSAVCADAAACAAQITQFWSGCHGQVPYSPNHTERRISHGDRGQRS